ncbi:uncharacterized protein [Fopius arisanus]|uniref:Uncharacterized protein n=2 Tax=Fopius arisanus TaxID=64838 RepID=A0A9R1T1E0_9HYME|nr:PREDICTED: uncharacterized protein LOC105265485 [Fopius arisanus]
MKYFGVILAVLAVFVCQNEASVSVVMNQLNKTVQSMQNVLEERRGHVAENQNSRLQAFMENFRGIVAHTVAATRKEFEGQGPECFSTLDGELNDAQNKVSPALEKCLQDNVPNAQPFESSINGLIVRGAEIQARMNEIEAECASENNVIARACIAKYIPRVSMSVGVYIAAAGKLRGQTAVSMGAAYAKIGSCALSPMKDFKVAVAIARRNARACTKVQ